jgi:hypothetical protein
MNNIKDNNIIFRLHDWQPTRFLRYSRWKILGLNSCRRRQYVPLESWHASIKWHSETSQSKGCSHRRLRGPHLSQSPWVHRPKVHEICNMTLFWTPALSMGVDKCFLTPVSKKFMETSLYPKTLSHINKMKRNCSLNLIKRLTVSFILVQQNVVCVVTGPETLP